MRQVWPRVHRRMPDAVLTIIGKSPPASLSSVVHGLPSVEVTGYVDDPTPYLSATGAFIVPLFAAGGMRVKILDAWCWGLPIVSTSIGAEGIDYRAGENIFIADEPAEFAAAVVRLLNRPELANGVRRRGRQWVEERYDWHQVYQRWDEVYEPLATGREGKKRAMAWR